MGCAGSSPGALTNEIQGGNGPLRKGSRVQSQDDEGDNHDNQWYVGTVEAVYDSGKAKVAYDDGDSWTGDAVWIFNLPPGHPGHTQKVPGGSPTQAGPPGMVNSNAVPVGPPEMQPMGMQPMGMQPMGMQPMGMQPMGMQPMGMQPMGMQPMGGMAPPMQPGSGMHVMTVTANVPGGQPMTLQGPTGPMQVQVPPGIQPGQQFQFQVAAEPMAQPMMAQPVMAQPVMAQPVMGMAQPV